MVFEIDLQNEVVRLKSIDEPIESAKFDEGDSMKGDTSVDLSSGIKECTIEENFENIENDPWPSRFNDALMPFLSENAIEELKTMFLQGSEPPTSNETVDCTQESPTNVIQPQAPDQQETTSLDIAHSEGIQRDGEDGDISQKKARGGQARGNTTRGKRVHNQDDPRKIVSKVCTSSIGSLCCILST
jgi:tRNA pseudouridine13 synthase